MTFKCEILDSTKGNADNWIGKVLVYGDIWDKIQSDRNIVCVKFEGKFYCADKMRDVGPKFSKEDARGRPYSVFEAKDIT